MALEKVIDGLNIFKGPAGRFLEFRWDDIEKSLRVFRDNDLSCLTIDHPLNQGIQDTVDLEFLSKMGIKKLIIYLDPFTELKSLYCLKELEYLLVMSVPNLDFDLEQLTALKYLETHWYSGYKNLSRCKSLTSLQLNKYKSSEKNLSELAGLKNLEYLKIAESNIIDVSGIENLTHLKQLVLAYNKSLLYFMKKDAVKMHLEELHIEVCKKLDLTTLKGLDHLKTLRIENNGKVPSLDPLLKLLPALEILFFAESEIIEGDNSYFLKYPNLKKVYFNNRKHYKLKVEQVREALEDDYKRLALLEKLRN